MTLISAVATSVLINVTTIVIATTAPVESSSSDSSALVKLKQNAFCHFVISYIYIV